MAVAMAIRYRSAVSRNSGTARLLLFVLADLRQACNFCFAAIGCAICCSTLGRFNGCLFLSGAYDRRWWRSISRPARTLATREFFFRLLLAFILALGER